MDPNKGTLQVTIASVLNRRNLAIAALVLFLSACKVIPGGGPRPGATPDLPDANVLPADSQRHRIAILVPLAGTNAVLGRAIANGANMALIDSGAKNLRLTQYDTSTGAAAAAAKAIADGNKLILGPLQAQDVAAVAATARDGRVPVISFTNDERVAGRGVFVMGSLPGQSIARTVAYAHGQGVRRFAALIPTGDYGQQASAALLASARSAGASVAAMESYERTSASLASAVRRLKGKGGYDAVLIADGARFAARAAAALGRPAAPNPRLLGTELWSGEGILAATPALKGALFAALSDGRFRTFATSYRARHGAAPPRQATLGYDAVLLSVRLARDWKVGTVLPTTRLTESDSFLGVDGPFRFSARGVIERAFEVREVREGSVAVVSEAPAGFGQ